MPWDKEKDHPECPAAEPWGVVKEGGELEGCHATEAEADAQLAALYASERSVPMSERLRELFDRFIEEVQRALGLVEREWDGSASRWPSTSEYCASCLLDVNAAAGKDEKAQSHCMLPVTNPGSDEYDKEGIHAAAQRFGQVKKPDDVPQDDWDAAVKGAANKLITAYSGFDEVAPDSVYEAAGKEPPAERAISWTSAWEQVWTEVWEGGGMWLVDMYFDDGEAYAIATKDGKLFRASATIHEEGVTLGEWQQVVELHEPLGRTVVKRQADGRYRWFAVSAAAVLNRVGEIDSMALFDSFERHIAETGEWPTRDFWHYDGEAFEIGVSDFVMRDGALLLTSGLYHEKPLAEAVARATIAEPDWWGDSIYFAPTTEPEMVEIAEGVRVPVYTAGELRRIASCKEAVAGSLYTRCVTHREVNRMRAEVLETLEKLRDEQHLDVDVFDELVALADGTNRAIGEAGVVVREDPETPGEGVAVEGAEEFVLSDALVDEVVGRAMERQQFTELRTELAQVAEDLAAVGKLLELSGEAHDATAAVSDELAERLAALERDDEEKLKETLADLPASRRRQTVVTYRPRDVHGKGPAVPATMADTAQETLAVIKGYPTSGRKT